MADNTQQGQGGSDSQNQQSKLIHQTDKSVEDFGEPLIGTKLQFRGIIAVSISISILAGSFFGYSTGVIAGALSSLDKTFGDTPQDDSDELVLDDRDKEFITAATVLGAAIGSLTAGYFCDKFGRKPLIIGMAIWAIAATLYLALCPNVVNVMVARLLVGVPVGVFSFAAPLYSSETSPPEHRGTLGVIFQLFLTFSIFFAYLMNLAFADVTDGWRYMFGIGVIFVVVMLVIGIFWMTRSPRWLITNDRADEAKEPLALIVGEKNVEFEIENIKESMKEGEATWFDVFSPEMAKPLYIGLVLCVANQLTGINAIIYYAPRIFADAGFDDNTEQVGITAGVGFWNFIATFIAVRYIDRFGRRKLMLTGLTLQAIGTGILGLSFLIVKNDIALAVLAIICILLFVTGFEMGPGPLFFVIMSEIYPNTVRGRAMSFINGIQWLLNLVISLFFLSVNNAIGGGPTFFIFFGVCVISFVLLAISLPETKGKTLDQIQEEMSGVKVKPEKSNGDRAALTKKKKKRKSMRGSLEVEEPLLDESTRAYA